MAQRAQFIDLSRTYLPIDPAALPQNLTTSDFENSPEKRIPVMAYEGHNFMPTAQGYRSYFGLNANIDLPALPKDCDIAFIYQKQDYTNLFVALCSDGIYINQGTESQEPWVKVADIGVESTEAAYRPWSVVVIGNTVYMYCQGDSQLWRIQIDPVLNEFDETLFDAYEVHPKTPSTLNMAGQMGIFKAGGRLGFWDSDNSVSWSAFEDHLDFVPAVKTQANLTKFVDVVGRIVTVRQHGDGFIIYATKSIVHVYKDLSNTFLWKASVISTNSGIAYHKQVVVANPDVNHFAWTATSLIQISDGKSEIIGTELYDYLKESANPVMLSLLEGRYLFLEIIEAAFLAGQVSVYSETYPATKVQLTDYVAAREILIDGVAITASIPAMPGDDEIVAIPAVVGVPDTPSAEGSYDIPPYQIFKLMNTVRDASKLGLIATPWYRTEGCVWPEYPTGYIQGYLSAVTDPDSETGEVPFFSFAATAYDTILNTTISYGGVPEAGSVLPNFYNNFAYIPNLAFCTEDDDTGKYSGAMSGLLNRLSYAADLVGAPAQPDVLNMLYNSVTDVTSPEDLFGKALTYWEKERKWIDDFLQGVKDHVYDYVDTAGTITSTTGSGVDIVFLENIAGNGYVAGYTDPLYIGLGSGYKVIRPGIDALAANNVRAIVTFYAPTSVKPEEYILKNDTYHMYQELKTYTKYEIIQYLQLSAPDIHGWVTYNASGGVVSLPIHASQAALLTWFDTVLNPGDAPHSLGALVTLSGYSDLFKGRQIIGASGNPNAYRAIPYGSFNFNVFYRWEETVVTADECKLQYHAWIPPVYKRYDVDGAIVDIDPQPASDMESMMWYCSLIDRTKPRFGSGGFAAPTLQTPEGPYAGGARWNGATLLGYGGYPGYSATASGDAYAGWNSKLVIDGVTYTYPAVEPVELTFPSGSFLLQDGSPCPAYPTFVGAFVYDLGYKRWGKMKGEYKKLLDYSPLNTHSSPVVSYTIFGVQGAVLKVDRIFYSFDPNPSDSSIKYGKIGMSRLGFTSLEEIHAQFRMASTGTISTETSLDGKTIDSSLTVSSTFANAKLASLNEGSVGKWHNILLTGQYDLVYLEYRSFTHGRR